MPARRLRVVLLFLPLLLAALGLHEMQVYADDRTVKHAFDGPMLQDQNQPALLNQERAQRDAEAAALKAKGNALIRQCWARVERHAKHQGKASFLSADVVRKEGLMIVGQVNLADAAGKPTIYDYRCRVDAGKQHVESVELEESDDDFPAATP